MSAAVCMLHLCLCLEFDSDLTHTPKKVETAMEANKENEIPCLEFLRRESGSEKRLYLHSFSTNSKMAKSLRHSYSVSPASGTRNGDSYLQGILDKLQVSIEQKSNEIDLLETAIMTLKTQRANQEFEIFKVEDKQAHLQKQFDALVSLIAELEHHERDSLQALNNKYQLQRKQHIHKHEESLTELKETITLEIEKAFDENLGRLVEEISTLKKRKSQLEQDTVLQDQDLNRRLIKLKEDHSKKLIGLNQSLDESLIMLKSAIEQVSEDKRTKEQQLQALLSSRQSNEISANNECHKTLHNLKLESRIKEEELLALKAGIALLNTELHATNELVAQMKREIDSYRDKSADIHRLMEHKEEIRRKLHNKLQELKGNIRVFCRVRPTCGELKPLANIEIPDLLLDDDSPNMLMIIRKPGDENFSSNSVPYQFLFDKIFSPTLSNSDVFKEISQLVQSSLDGYNVCVFAYGQTGSGKTFTMAHEADGMIPQSLKKVFEDIKTLESQDWQYELHGQFLEIYNEAIFDLLSPTKVSRSPSKNNPKKYEIKHDDVSGTTSVTNLTSVSITGADHAMKLLSLANKNRSTAYTKSNEHSSRSHSIFMLQLHGRNIKTMESRYGTLNLVDLAGSERLSNSQAQAERLKETQAINKSLSSLGDVISALKLSQKGKPLQHIPYRNSKLTYLLKNSLGGDCKTLMFVNISPFATNVNETLNSLRFASKVNATSQLRSK